jgi:hypothetical protein
MLKKHKNGFINIIKRCGLDPELFHGYEVRDGDYEVFKIELINSPLQFRVICSDVSYLSYNCSKAELAPGYPDSGFHFFDVMAGVETWNNNIDSVYSVFEDWINETVKEYLDEVSLPDLWANLQQQESFVSGDTLSKEDTSFFSDGEKTQLRLSINEFRLQIVNNFGPSEDQLKLIDDRLKYVADALGRLPRFDWKSLLLNSVLSISVALSLDSEKGKILYDLFKQVFLKIVYLLR